MQAGQVSGLIQIETAFTIVRAECPYSGAQEAVRRGQERSEDELQKSKYEKLRSGLAKQLRAKAKIEVV